MKLHHTRSCCLKTLYCLVLTLFLPYTLLAKKITGIEEDCHFSGSAEKNFKSPDATACQKSCLTFPDCRQFNFISGWNRCFIFTENTKKTKVVIHAAKVTHEKLEKSATIKRRFDNSGKDIDKKPLRVKEPEACAKECQSRKDCKGFSFIEGYDSCWLKNSHGDMRSKVFYCGKPSR